MTIAQRAAFVAKTDTVVNHRRKYAELREPRSVASRIESLRNRLVHWWDRVAPAAEPRAEVRVTRLRSRLMDDLRRAGLTGQEVPEAADID